MLALLREEFADITISKIRFLESQGLLDPERTPSGYRKFYDADVERLRWILRQQRENFLPLKVIKGRWGPSRIRHRTLAGFAGLALAADVAAGVATTALGPTTRQGTLAVGRDGRRHRRPASASSPSVAPAVRADGDRQPDHRAGQIPAPTGVGRARGPGGNPGARRRPRCERTPPAGASSPAGAT